MSVDLDDWDASARWPEPWPTEDIAMSKPKPDPKPEPVPPPEPPPRESTPETREADHNTL